jgi:uncharacterized protein YjgD (DUF1641 family)
MSIMPSPDQSVDEIARTAQAIREALTDQMIERVAVTGGNALELLDRLNDERTSNAIHRLIDRLTEMHQIGALDTACDLILALHGTRAALTDSMIERLFAFVEYLLNTLAHDDVGRIVENTRHALIDAAHEANTAGSQGGLMAAISLLSKPETQRSLKFLVAFTQKLNDQSDVT